MTYANTLYKEIHQYTDFESRYSYLTSAKDVNIQRFLKSYPVICKYMCLDQFSESAFKHVVNLQQEKNIENVNKKATTEQQLDDFICIQAEYARQLALEQKLPVKQAKKIYKESVKELKQTLSQAETDFKKYNDELLAEHKAELYQYLRTQLKL